MTYSRLFTPITIGNMTLKNRIVMPAMHHLYTENGYCTPRFSRYYWDRVEGGAGLIIVGSCRFDDCRHLREPGCAVREALERGEIAPSRYESYARLYEISAQLKDWEISK